MRRLLRAHVVDGPVTGGGARRRREGKVVRGEKNDAKIQHLVGKVQKKREREREKGGKLLHGVGRARVEVDVLLRVEVLLVAVPLQDVTQLDDAFL